LRESRIHPGTTRPERADQETVKTKRTYHEAVKGVWGREDFSGVTHVIEKGIGRKIAQK